MTDVADRPCPFEHEECPTPWCDQAWRLYEAGLRRAKERAERVRSLRAPTKEESDGLH